jgi:hypothetical protein
MSTTTTGTGGPSEGLDLYGRPSWHRSVSSWLGWGCCILAVLLIAAPILWVLWGVIDRAVPVWHWARSPATVPPST